MVKRMIQGWRYIMLAVLGVGFVWFVMQSNEQKYMLMEVGLLFLVLFAGYRFGSGTGAVAGSICGIIMAFGTGELAQMGIFSVLGVFSGAFRKLGRAASVTAYAAAAFGVGLLYSPELLFDSMIAVIIGGMIFLLLPGELTGAIPQKLHLQTLNYQTLEGTAGEQARQAGNAFATLAGYFSDEHLAQMIRNRDEQRDWCEKYLELRMLFSEQMSECAQMMEGICQTVGESAGLPAQMEKRLIERLEVLGVRLERAVVARGNGKRGDLFLLMSSQSERCVTMKLICEAVSEVLGRKMKLEPNQASIVSQAPRMVRLLEEPAFFMLHGVAQSKKEGSDCSGDSFSFIELDHGQAMFFLCDGMGSGEMAREESTRVTELTEQLCRAGFSSQTVVRLLNNALLVQGKERPVTIDMGVIDLYSGLCDFTKSGAAVTFICREDAVEELTGDSLPVGILRESAPIERLIKLRSGDMVVMMTDGVLEAIPGMEKEEQMKAFCMENKSARPRDFAARILRYAQSFGQEKDDMTVLIAGVWKK